MSPAWHVAASASLAGGVAAIGGDIRAVGATFLAGTALDADHLLDYYLNRSGKFTVRRFLAICNQYRLRRLFLFAHSLELIIPAILAAFMLDSPLWLRGAALSIGVHMAMDLYANGMYPKAYFLSWRIAVGFDFRRAIAWLPQSGLEYWGSYRAFMKGKPDKRGTRRTPA